MELTTDETILLAQGYSKMAEYDKALSLLSEITTLESTWDSLKYASVKIDILEKLGKYEQALTSYRKYSGILERYQKNCFHKIFYSLKRNIKLNSKISWRFIKETG